MDVVCRCGKIQKISSYEWSKHTDSPKLKYSHENVLWAPDWSLFMKKLQLQNVLLSGAGVGAPSRSSFSTSSPCPRCVGADVGGGGGVEPSADGAGLGPPAGGVSSSWRTTARSTCDPPPWSTHSPAPERRTFTGCSCRLRSLLVLYDFEFSLVLLFFSVPLLPVVDDAVQHGLDLRVEAGKFLENKVGSK